MGSGPVLARGSEREWPSVPPGVVVVPTLAVLVAETAIFLDAAGVALLVHLLTLVGCVLVPLRVDSEIPLAFALVPLFRIVNLGMPVFVELTLVFFPLVYAPLLPATYLLARRLSVEVHPGWRTAAVLAVPGVVLAAALAQLEYLIIRPERLVSAWEFGWVALLVVVMVGFVGLVEELLFRGVLQRLLVERVGRLEGLAVASGLFGAMHSAYGSLPEVGFATAIGLLFGLVYERTDSLVLITLIHGVLNVFLFGVVPVFGSL